MGDKVYAKISLFVETVILIEVKVCRRMKDCNNRSFYVARCKYTCLLCEDLDIVWVKK